MSYCIRELKMYTLFSYIYIVYFLHVQFMLSEPRVLQKLLCRWSVPWIQFHHLSDEISVRPCKFVIFRLAERKPLFVLLDVDDCTRADC